MLAKQSDAILAGAAKQNHYYATTLRFVIHFTCSKTEKQCFGFSYSTDPKATRY